jgi:tRNA modification GTPase
MSSTSDVNRASVLTPPGRGAVAVVAVTGPAGMAAVDQGFQAANGRRLFEQPLNRIVFGHWSSGSHREEVVVVRTAPDSLEVHCHGGIAASERITGALQTAGCDILSWEDWVEGAYECLVRAEAAHALARATTRRAASILLEQFDGALSREVELIRRELGTEDNDSAIQGLQTLLARAPLGLHLAEPWSVAIAGKPNVGKSSLINALAGYQRAIVFDKPGTTRDVLSVDTAIDGWPARLSDAAGIRETVDPLEAEGVSLARQQLGAADLVLWVLDASGLLSQHDCRVLIEQEIGNATDFGADLSTKVLLVANKTDLLSPSTELTSSELIGISALTRSGIDELLARISQRLVLHPPRAGDGVPFTSRQLELLHAALDYCRRHEWQAADESLGRISGEKQ